MILFENLKYRWEEYVQSKKSKDNPTISGPINNLFSNTGYIGRLFYYVTDEFGHKRLHHYSYGGIYIATYNYKR